MKRIGSLSVVPNHTTERILDVFLVSLSLDFQIWTFRMHRITSNYLVAKGVLWG